MVQGKNGLQAAGSVLMEINTGKERVAEEERPAGELLRAVNQNDIDGWKSAGQSRDSVFTNGVSEVMVEENMDAVDGMDTVDSSIIAPNDVTDSAPASSLFSQFEETMKYNMGHKERGCFLIFNMEVFDPHLELDNRVGSRKDAFNLYHTAKHMGFEYIQTFHNLKKSDLFDWLNAVSRAVHRTYDGFGCAILTHGDDGDTLYARDASFKLSDCTALFTADNCPTLAGKPKLFFIQACRGLSRDKGSAISLQQLCFPGRMATTTKIPNHADFLIASSTVPGFLSWRNQLNGSWFVQALHHCFSKYAKSMELVQIMTKVNSMVAYCFESHSNERDNGYKQIPAVTSQLTAEVYFHKFDLENDPYCPVCSNQLQSRDSNSSSQDVPSASKSSVSSGSIRSEKQNMKRSTSVRKWIRKSLRRKTAK